MKAKFCDLCGKETHTRTRVLRYTEELLRVNSDTHAYDVCDECSRKIDEAKNEAEFNTVKAIRDEYLAGKDIEIPSELPSDNPSELPSDNPSELPSDNPSDVPPAEDSTGSEDSSITEDNSETKEEIPSDSTNDSVEEIGE